MEYFKILPVEITLEILTRLPAESVLECRSVCKPWNNLISRHPSFSKMHLHHLNNPSAADSGKLSFLSMGKNKNHPFNQLYYFEYNEDQESISRIRRINLTLPFICLGVVGSFNGLICLYGSQDNEIYGPACICNPITRECIILPKYASPTNLRWKVFLGGFGYLPSANEYKVVRICKLKGEAHFVEVEVYTLGSSNGWRNLGKFDYNLDISHCINGAFANGALYWMDKDERIVPFDLAEEKFCGYLLPPSLPFCNSDVPRLGVWDGFLQYNFQHGEGDSSESDIWLLKEREKHQSLSWSKEFTLVKNIQFGFTKSGCVLEDRDGYFYIYDPKSSTSKMLVASGSDVCQILPHKNSLVTLKELGEEDTKILESGEIEDAYKATVRKMGYLDLGMKILS